MKREAAAGFLLTVGVLVPAGWHSLQADIEHDGKHMRPMQQETTIDDVKVTLDVDRAVVMTGDTVTATLVATSDKPKDVTVDLRALHTQNYSGERVERPWQQIDRETITLHAAPGGGKPVTTRIKLGERPAELALEDSFKIMVTKAGLKPVVREFDGGKAPDYDALGPSGVTSDNPIAGVYIRGWSGNSLGMKLVPEGTVASGKPFTIAVHIKNTSGHKLESRPWVSLSTQEDLQATDEPAVDIQEIESDDRSDADGNPKPLKRNAEFVERFTVTPHKKLAGAISFLATATENEGLGPHGAGAMDIATFKITDTGEPVAVVEEPSQPAAPPVPSLTDMLTPPAVAAN
ncbi:MAG: hypothetical protein JO257_12190 [Deltaproteobacteria bacterium]|nr:hypothetical protein [Deltaproteobacteria bacterium]